MMMPLLYGVEGKFRDFSFAKIQWNQLYYPWNKHFEWKVGITPFSNWQLLPITWGIYFTTIFLLWIFMRNRKPYSLKLAVCIHNAILCIGSLVMFVGVMYEIYELLQKGGMKMLYCDTKRPTGRVYYWMYIYYLSKFVELFDTVILILKKRPLIFLHVYHHAIVILMVWLWLTHSLVYSAMGTAFNTFVHVFMYYYYAISALGFNVWWKIYITNTQIFQFVCSFLLSIPYIFYTLAFDPFGNLDLKCHGWTAFGISFFINSSFLVLFVNFWLKTYKKDNSTKKN